jgi:two-component system chemotaxis response regulator CheY
VSKRLLIVDDAEFLRMAVREIAKEVGFEEIEESSNADQALEMFCRSRPHLVVLDLRLPRVNGVEVLKSLRRLDPAARIVALGSLNQNREAKEALSAGALTVVTKPFAREHLRDVLRHFR